MGDNADSWQDAAVRSADVGPNRNWNEYLNRALQKHYVLKEALNLWQGPMYRNYCSLINRVRSFENADWPKLNPTPVFLAEAGFINEVSELLFLHFR